MPNPNPPIRPRIEDEGILIYLNRTKAEHNGYGSDEFVKRHELKEPLTVRARAFNVSSATMRYWVEIYGRKLAKKDQQP